MKTVYVVWEKNDGAYQSDIIKIEGKVNHLSIEKAIRDKLGYYKTDFWRIISWQEEEPFTAEERDEFWKNY